MAPKQKVADIVATLDAETASFDKKIKDSGDKLGAYGKKAKQADGDNKKLGQSFNDAADRASNLPGPIGDAAGKITSLTGNVTKLGAAWSVAGGAIAIGIGAISAGLPTLAETERRLLQQEQLLRATGYSSGFTAQQLDEMARSVAMATLTSTQAASQAIGVMLTFRSVTGETFERSIALAQDMASVMGGDIVGSAKQLGKALEMPTQGVSALAESGVSFSQAQKEMIKDMEETGRIADAQTFILDELQRQIGGAAGAEAGGLTGTVDTFGQTWEEMLEAIADKSGSMFVAKTTLQGLIDIAAGLTNLIDPKPMVEFNDLMKERMALQAELNELGDSNAWFGKDRRLNAQRRLAEVTERMIELQDEYKARQIAQNEAQEKAAQAAADREKARQEEKAARDKAAADKAAAAEQKRQDQRDAAEKKAADAKRDRDQATTDTWLVELERRNMTALQLLDARYVDEVTKLKEKLDEELITQEQYEQSRLDIEAYYSQQRVEKQQEENKKKAEENQTFWDKYYESMKKSTEDTDELWANTFDNFTTGFGNAFASAVLDSETAGEAFRNMAAGMAQSMLAALGKIMAQRMVMWALEKTMGASEASSTVSAVTAEAQSAAALAGIHAYASTAAIPIYGPELAPAAAATALAATEPMAAAATAAAAAGYAGMFDNGGYIPAGQWGITGEYGPEITMGPTNVVGRRQTMDMLRQATEPTAAPAPASESNIFQFTIQAIDAQGVQEVLMNNRDVIYNAVSAVKRDQGERF